MSAVTTTSAPLRVADLFPEHELDLTPFSWKEIPAALCAEAGLFRVNDLVGVPYRNEHGDLHRVKFFAPSGRSWWDHRSWLGIQPWGIDRLPLPPLRSDHDVARRALLLYAEGESDRLCAIQAFRELGLEAFVIALPGAGVWRSEWAWYARPFPVVIAAGDADGAGQRMTSKITRDVPWAHALTLPRGDDVRSYYQREGAAALLERLEESTQDRRLLAAIKLAPDLDMCQSLLRGGAIA